MTNSSSLSISERFISEEKVSRITGIAIQTLRNHRFRGVGIPYHKIGRSVRYNLEDVYQYMQSHKIETER